MNAPAAPPDDRSDAYAEIGGYGAAPEPAPAPATEPTEPTTRGIDRLMPWRLDRPGRRPLHLASFAQAREFADELLPGVDGVCLVDETSGEAWRRLPGPAAQGSWGPAGLAKFHWERFA